MISNISSLKNCFAKATCSIKTCFKKNKIQKTPQKNMDFNKYSFLYEEKIFMFSFIHSGISKRKKESKTFLKLQSPQKSLLSLWQNQSKVLSLCLL